jgi:hypothetical protein
MRERERPKYRRAHDKNTGKKKQWINIYDMKERIPPSAAAEKCTAGPVTIVCVSIHLNKKTKLKIKKRRKNLIDFIPFHGPLLLYRLTNNKTTQNMRIFITSFRAIINACILIRMCRLYFGSFLIRPAAAERIYQSVDKQIGEGYICIGL